jgi:hypothetical protein
MKPKLLVKFQIPPIGFRPEMDYRVVLSDGGLVLEKRVQDAMGHVSWRENSFSAVTPGTLYDHDLWGPVIRDNKIHTSRGDYFSTLGNPQIPEHYQGVLHLEWGGREYLEEFLQPTISLSLDLKEMVRHLEIVPEGHRVRDGIITALAILLSGKEPQDG